MSKQIESPLVSVLMTAYNREKYIAEAIESVLASTYKNFELIIVDDCSSDATLQIAKDYELKDARIKVFKNEHNLGDYPNRNKAASYAKGKYLKYIDSDDIIYPHSLEIMVEAMEIFPEAGMGIPFTSDNYKKKYPCKLSSREALIIHFSSENFLGYGPSAIIYRTSTFRENSGFDKFGVASDFALNLKIGCNNDVVLLQRDLNWWRAHDEQEYTKFFIDYLKLNNNIIHKYIVNNDNNLKDNERLIIIRNQKNIYARKVILNLLKIKIKEAILIHKGINLKLTDYFKCLKKNIILTIKNSN